MPAIKKISKKKVAKVNLKFILDCTQVAQDSLLQPKNFSEFLQNKIKVRSRFKSQLVARCWLTSCLQVQNKTGHLGDSVKVETDDKKVTVKSTIPLSKRYLKYLAKKYLKRNNVRLAHNAMFSRSASILFSLMQLRNFLHVVSTDKNKYELKYFNIDSKAEDGEE